MDNPQEGLHPTQNGEEKVIIVDRRKVDYSIDPYKEDE